MKRFLFLLVTGFCAIQLLGQTVNFSVQPLSEGSELSAASQEMLQNKLNRLLPATVRVRQMTIMFLS